ncbi:hypothetical protein D3C73_1454560 [compost metagenome]
MLENYHDDGQTEESKRLLAVQAALEIIKATLSDTNDGNSVGFQLDEARKHIAPLANAIQLAVEKK